MKISIRSLLLLFILVFSVGASRAQRIDSLEKVINRTPKEDKQHIDAMNMLSRDLSLIDPYRSARLASEALQTSLRTGYKKGQANGYRILASIFSNNDNNIIAEEYLLRAMEIFRAEGDSAGIANCYITRGNMMRRMQRREEELESQQKAYTIFNRLQIRERIAVSAHNLGETYQLMGKDSLARELTQLAISLNDSVQNISVLSNCYKVLGKLDRVAGRDEQAITDFKKVLELSAQLGVNSQKVATVEALLNLAMLYGKTGNKELELSYYKQAVAFSAENIMPNYLDSAYTGIIDYYGGDHGAVSAYTREYRSKIQEIISKQLKRKTELEKYGVQIFNLLETEKIRLERDNINQSHRIRNKNLVMGLSIAVILFLAGLLLFLLKLMRERKKALAEIRDQAEQLRLLTARIQDVREEERALNAWEIHEGLGQQLIVVKMDIAWLKENVKNPDERTLAKLKELDELLLKSITRVREIATSMRPGLLDDLGLAVAIKWQLEEFEKRYEVKTSLTDKLGERELPETIRTGLFRIFQESLSNIGWHAHAKNVQVLLQAEEAGIMMQIKDDGQAYKLGEIASERSLGFLDMRERCNQMKGQFGLHSSPGRGTTITVKVPLPDQWQ